MGATGWWWSGLGSEVKRAAKTVQSNPLVREAEKKAVSYGAKTLRVAAEGALDWKGDTVGHPGRWPRRRPQ